MNIDKKKQKVAECINELKDILTDINSLKEGRDKENKILERTFLQLLKNDFLKMSENLKPNLKAVTRDHIKCVVFGKTSNGKSATINALLGENLLISDFGITTPCFIEIIGCSGDTGYVMLRDETEMKSEKYENHGDLSEIQIETFDEDKIKNLNKDEIDELYKDKRLRLDWLKYIANRKNKNCCSADQRLQVYYPASKCKLLANNVHIIDCPGVDYDSKYDKLIDEYCEDTNVFLLVVDCVSGLSLSEQNFFKKFKEKTSKPNVITLVNKWDQTIGKTEEVINSIKEQHENELGQFIEETFEIKKELLQNQMYFVSAKNALIKEDEAFEQFNFFLVKSMCQKIHEIIIKPNTDRILSILSFLDNLINSIAKHTNENDAVDRRNQQDENYESKINDLIVKCLDKITKRFEEVIAKHSEEAIEFITKAMENKMLFENEISLLESQFTNVENQNKSWLDVLSINVRDHFMNCQIDNLEDTSINEEISRTISSGLTTETITKIKKQTLRLCESPIWEEVSKLFQTSIYNYILSQTEVLSDIRDRARGDTNLSKDLNSNVPQDIDKLISTFLTNFLKKVKTFQVSLDDRATDYLEKDIPNECCRILSEEIADLKTKIINYFIQWCGRGSNEEEMQTYVNWDNLESSFKTIINVQFTSTSKDISEIVKKGQEFWSRAYQFILSIFEKLKSKLSKDYEPSDLEVVKHFKNFYNRSVQKIKDALNSKIRETESLNRFMKHLEEILETESKFEELKNRCSIMRRKVEEINNT